MSVLSVADVKLRLNKTVSADDAELQAMLDAAEARYAEVVGPVGTNTVPYTGGPLPRYATGAVVTDSDGNLVDPSVYIASPYLYWNVPAGAMGHGLYGYELTLTYTTTIPAHHREAILADVAGYFVATQRGGGQTAPRFPGEGYAEPLGNNPNGLLPVTLFPRIEALALTSTPVG